MQKSKASLWRQQPDAINRAVLSLLASASLLALLPQSAVAAQGDGAWRVAQATRSYDIPAGPLSQVLPRFAAEAGVQLSADAALTQGQNSPGVQGAHSVESGFAAALGGSGLRIEHQADGSYALRRMPQAQPAAASGSGGAKQLSEVAVTASAGASGNATEGTASYTTGEIGVFKIGQSLRGTPQPVTVVTRQSLDDQALPNLQAVLQNTPGVTVDYTDSERVNYYSRGYTIDTIQFDGVTVSSSGLSTFIQPDTAVIDHLEVLRGSSGLLKGSGNPSATVNLVRKKPTAGFQASASATIGSWERRRVEGDISGSLNEARTLRGRIVAVAEDKEFFQKGRGGEDRQVFYGVVEADLTRRTLLTAGLEYTDLDTSGAWGGLPAAADGSQLGLSRDTYLGASWNHWNRTNRHAFVELEHVFENAWKLKFNANSTRMKLKDAGFLQTYFYDSASSSDPYIMDAYVAAYNGDASRQNTFSLTADGAFKLFGREHVLLLGAETRTVKNASSYGFWGMNAITGIDIRNWNPYTGIGQPDVDFGSTTNSDGGTYYASNPNETRQHGAYAAARFSLADPLTAIAGARLSWWKYEVPNSPGSNYSVSREVSPYFGLVYDFSKNWSAYASYSEIFTPQRFYDAGGRIIDPVRGDDYEAGVKGEFFDGRLNAALSVFRINNVGAGAQDTGGANPCLPYYPNGYCYVADGKTRSQGWEIELAGELLPNWHVTGGYTNTRTEYLKDGTASNVGQPLRTLDPRHLLKLYSTYRFSGALRGLTLGAGVNAQSDSYSTARGVTYRQGGYAIYNAMASYQFNRQWQLQLNANNLSDKVYYKKVGSGVNNYYGDPRNFALTLKAKF